MTEGILNALIQHVQHITCGNNIIEIQYHMHRAGSKLLFSVPQPFQKKTLKKNQREGLDFPEDIHCPPVQISVSCHFLFISVY